ncbi:MAG: hypothetical protein R3264_17285, partial [Anaerolineae bacterium]|nr:hypothetical protein [Anaerolineae bacterium]
LPLSFWMKSVRKSSKPEHLSVSKPPDQRGRELVKSEPNQHQHLRLCFGSPSTETIREAEIVLSDLIRERIGERVQPTRIPLSRMPLV